MELGAFVLKFANQFDDTDVAEINENTVFSELEEWSSLVTLSVIAMIKVDYGKTVTGAEIRSCRTVNDLFVMVREK